MKGIARNRRNGRVGNSNQCPRPDMWYGEYREHEKGAFAAPFSSLALSQPWQVRLLVRACRFMPSCEWLLTGQDLSLAPARIRLEVRSRRDRASVPVPHPMGIF